MQCLAFPGIDSDSDLLGNHSVITLFFMTRRSLSHSPPTPRCARRQRRLLAATLGAALFVASCASSDGVRTDEPAAASTASEDDDSATVPPTNFEDTATETTLADAAPETTPDNTVIDTGTDPVIETVIETGNAPVEAAPAREVIDVAVASGVVPIVAIANEDDPALPDGAVERIVEHEGHDIFSIEIAGEGPPIVLLHGFPDHLSLYDEVYPLLAGRRVIAFDFIGWGRSSKPAPGEEYSFTTPGQAAELAAVIEAYDLSDITLVVHDQSAPVGLEFLLQSEELVGELVFLQGFFMASPNLLPPKGIELHADDRLQAAELALQLDPAAVEAYHRFQMDEFIVSSPNEAEMIDRLWALFPEARPAFIALNDILIEEVIDRTGRVEQLRELTTPVDIVYGELDPYLTPELGAEFDEIFANSQLTIVPNAGHFVQIDAPQVVADAILART